MFFRLTTPGANGSVPVNGAGPGGQITDGTD
jgi:hypothetical protein